jgi:hypothetical protein
MPVQHHLQAVCLLLPAYDSDRIAEPQVVVEPLARNDDRRRVVFNVAIHALEWPASRVSFRRYPGDHLDLSGYAG